MAAARLVRYSKLGLIFLLGYIGLPLLLFSKPSQRGPSGWIWCWLASDSANNDYKLQDIAFKTDPVGMAEVPETPPADISSYASFDRFSISPAPCSNMTPPFLLLIIYTRPNAFQRRDTIRRTYGSLAIDRRANRLACSQPPTQISAVGFRLLFIVGQTAPAIQAQIADEATSNGDIIQSEAFVDGYHQATRKGLALIHWSLLHCPQAAFTAKADDDCWLNPPLLLESLRGYLPQSPSIYGLIFRYSTPIREPKNKWAVTTDEYPDAEFPPYLSGVLYVFHSAALAPVAKVSTKLKYLWHDDIFITGLAARKAGISHTSLDGYDISGRIWNWCCSKTFYLVVHSMNDTTMWRLWNTPCTYYAVPC